MSAIGWIIVGAVVWADIALFAWALCRAAADADRRDEQCRRRASRDAELNRGLRRASTYLEAK